MRVKDELGVVEETSDRLGFNQWLFKPLNDLQLNFTNYYNLAMGTI